MSIVVFDSFLLVFIPRLIDDCAEVFVSLTVFVVGLPPFVSLFFLPLVFVFVLVGVFVSVSVSVFVFVDVPLLVALFVIVGLLLLVIPKVLFGQCMFWNRKVKN